MSRMIVFAVYTLVGIVGCVMSVQLLIRIAIYLTPCVQRVWKCCSLKDKVEWVKKQRSVYPILIYDIPTAQVTHVDNIPYPASIVSTAAVEIV